MFMMHFALSMFLSVIDDTMAEILLNIYTYTDTHTHIYIYIHYTCIKIHAGLIHD